MPKNKQLNIIVENKKIYRADDKIMDFKFKQLPTRYISGIGNF